MTAAAGSAGQDSTRSSRRDPSESASTRQGQRAPRQHREALANQWWSQRFTAVLEGYGLGPRMERGRRYARGGRVKDLIVKAGRLEARVQGSRATPYRVSVRSEAASKAQWRSLELLFASRLGWAAQMLAGEVPPTWRRPLPKPVRPSSRAAGPTCRCVAAAPTTPNPANISPPCSMSSPSNSMAIRGCCWPGTAAIARRCCRRCSRGLRGRRPAATKLEAMGGRFQRLKRCRPGGRRGCGLVRIHACSLPIPCPPIRRSGRCNDWGRWSYPGRRRIGRSAWRRCIGSWWRRNKGGEARCGAAEQRGCPGQGPCQQIATALWSADRTARPQRWDPVQQHHCRGQPP